MRVEYEIRVVKQDAIYNEVSPLETIDDCGFLVFKGFHYFSYNNIKWSSLFAQEAQQEPVFFLAYKGSLLVGVLKVVAWNALAHFSMELFFAIIVFDIF